MFSFWFALVKSLAFFWYEMTAAYFLQRVSIWTFEPITVILELDEGALFEMDYLSSS